jgi:hypothetical protein
MVQSMYDDIAKTPKVLPYADDVTLIVYDDPAQLQRLLDCPSISCAIFKMEVNQHE